MSAESGAAGLVAAVSPALAGHGEDGGVAGHRSRGRRQRRVRRLPGAVDQDRLLDRIHEHRAVLLGTQGAGPAAVHQRAGEAVGHLGREGDVRVV
jgi:hypothetical protein